MTRGKPTMRWKLLASCAMLTALGAGCVNYDERIELNGDGSGVVRLHLAVSEQVLPVSAGAKGQKEDDLLPTPRKDLIAELEKQGFKVRSLRAESLQGLRHFYVVLEFRKLDDVAAGEVFGGRKISLKREGGKWEFRSDILVSEKTLTDRAHGAKGDEPKGAPEPQPAPKKPAGSVGGPAPDDSGSVSRQLEQRFGKNKVRQMFSAYSITFSVEMPGATLLRTNGVNHRDAVAVWETPLDRFIDSKPTIHMEADFARAAPGDSAEGKNP